MNNNQENSPTLTEPVLTGEERAWEGHIAGDHWIAKVVQLDEEQGICGLYVATGADRDRTPARPNCRWDYECDHILNRFSEGSVPPGVTCEMMIGLRRWLDEFRRRRDASGLGLNRMQAA